MPVIVDLRDDIKKYLQNHGLWKKWLKAKMLFEQNPSHNSLNTELLEPSERHIYSFRIDKKHRVLFICLPEDKVEVIAEFPEWISYDFPPRIAQSMKPFIGQKQRYFLVKLQEDAVIDIKTEEPEFIDYKFVSVDEALNLSASFKKDVYTSVINYFKEEGLL